MKYTKEEIKNMKEAVLGKCYHFKNSDSTYGVDYDVDMIKVVDINPYGSQEVEEDSRLSDAECICLISDDIYNGYGICNMILPLFDFTNEYDDLSINAYVEIPNSYFEDIYETTLKMIKIQKGGMLWDFFTTTLLFMVINWMYRIISYSIYGNERTKAL